MTAQPHADPPPVGGPAWLVAPLRAAGCVFADAVRAGWRTARHDYPDVPTCVLELRPAGATDRTFVA